jgi:hypothetical protein
MLEYYLLTNEHLQAPKDIADHFADFLAKQDSTTRVGFPSPSRHRDQGLSSPKTPPGGSILVSEVKAPRDGLKPVDYDDEFYAPSKYWAPIELREGELSLIEVCSTYFGLFYLRMSYWALSERRCHWRVGMTSSV